MRFRVKYSKPGLMKFIGHLDMMRYFQKALKRAGIDVAYTEGMSPHMSMSFALPLGVGMTSDSEYVDVDLATPLPSDEIVERLNRSLPDGVHFTQARQIPIGKAHKGMSVVARADYTLTIRPEYAWDAAWAEEFSKWLETPQIFVLKKGKKTEKEIDIRPLIYEAHFEGENLILGLSAGLDRNIRPELVMKAFADATRREYRQFMFHINRDEVFADKGSAGHPVFVSLIDLGETVTEESLSKENPER